ncbi:helix-turn-helix domain containing protein [Phenylobacterium sp. LjRoot225]|uniref:TetR/AcrR family transcriptional regulator n=1 Tax=Phenylobacterium sp. LjRoot225 TaxID=3342285 RepID=UPI003ED0FA0F
MTAPTAEGAKQASNRRIGLEQSKTRALLLDAADAVMREEGYAGVSSRRVASRAGLKPQLVHYYFRTMDDLFLALFRRRSEKGLEHYAEALASDRPLRAMWEMSRDPSGTAMIMEFSALANHRKVISAEIAHYGDRLREMQVAALSRLLATRGVDPDAYPPIAVAVLISSVSLFLRMEDRIGMSAGHAETEALVERWLNQLESPAAQPPPATV